MKNLYKLTITFLLTTNLVFGSLIKSYHFSNKTQTANSSIISNASNINANNIFINTNDKFSQRVQSTRNTNTNITGSNVIASNDILVNTNNLNVKASQDIYNSSSNTKSLNGSVSQTLGNAGLNFNLAKGKNSSISNSLINNNSQIVMMQTL